MATSQGQDVLRCQLCPNPVEHHCNLCHVDLCVNCVSKHLTDKSKRHEVVNFIYKKEEPILPECKSHDKKLCEVYCNDCHEPTCVLCVTTTHNKHDITDIKSIIDSLKKRIADDIEEIENIIRPKYKKGFDIGNSSAEFDKLMNAIQDQEDNICKVVREIGSRLKDEVAKQKKEFEQKDIAIQSSVAKEEKKLNEVIKTNEGILKSSNTTCILTYQSRNEQLRVGQRKLQISYPMFLSGYVSQDQLQKPVGSLQGSSNIALKGTLALQNPVVLSTIQTPFGKKRRLIAVLCDEPDRIWISGNNGDISQINQIGLTIKTLTGYVRGSDFSLSVKKELVFSEEWPDTKVYRNDDDEVRTVVDLHQWCPCGLCHSVNGDLLVSMRSVDKTQSRVAQYSGTTEALTVQHDSQGKPLFSVRCTAMLHLTENGNGDICVADKAGEVVVVVSASGQLQFKYKGNIYPKTESPLFRPSKIATDVNQQILINESVYDIVHVIDKDGNFLRYIEYPCSGGLSIDRDHNLVVGSMRDRTIRIIKYLK